MHFAEGPIQNPLCNNLKYVHKLRNSTVASNSFLEGSGKSELLFLLVFIYRFGLIFKKGVVY